MQARVFKWSSQTYHKPDLILTACGVSLRLMLLSSTRFVWSSKSHSSITSGFLQAYNLTITTSSTMEVCTFHLRVWQHLEICHKHLGNYH